MSDTSTFTVPVIDIGSSMTAGRAVGDVAEQLDRACREVGFFAVTGHGVSDATRDAVLDAAHRFFAQPSDVKAQVAIQQSPNNRGYGAVADEQLQPDLPGDLKETFDIGLEMSFGDPNCSPLDGPNQWPDLDGFREPLEAYQDQALGIVVLLMRIVAHAFGLPHDRFDACHEHSLAALRLVHYPQADQRTADDQPGCGAHSDYGTMTLLFSDETPGLQLMDTSGTWIDVNVPDDALIVNLGDLLQRWTNDMYRSTPHRVVPPTERDRYSVPVFVVPTWGAEVACLEPCITAERPAVHPPVLAGEYLLSRFEDTFSYLRTPAT